MCPVLSYVTCIPINEASLCMDSFPLTHVNDAASSDALENTLMPSQVVEVNCTVRGTSCPVFIPITH